MNLFRRAVERRLGGYRHAVNSPDPGLPLEAPGRRVAVVGAGLAGLTAALTLARRGFAVDLYEAQSYLGGKVGAWPVEVAGETQYVEHGFHAFFRHYHNLNRLLDSLNLRRSFRAIEDYTILTRDGHADTFAGIDKTPLFNLLSMRRQGAWSWGQLLSNPRLAGLLAMFRYDPEKTFQRYDDVSYQEWADRLGIPAAMRLMFNSFSRAFFATPDRMSVAELLKSFHTFFLSHDGGLEYDYPTKDYHESLLTPLRDELERLGTKVFTDTSIASVGRGASFHVEGRSYDGVVIATPAVSARDLVAASPELFHPPLAESLASLRPSQGYAVLRLWTDRALETALPAFVITEHRRVLDSVSFYDRLEEPSLRWVQRHGGAVYELHCYALPDTSPSAVRDALIEEFYEHFPALKGMAIVHEHLRVANDFTALHTGMHARRPVTSSGIPGLVFAGDWVKLPFPAMLMEAAASSGLLAANALLTEAGLREEPIWSVPPRGLFARKS